MNWGVLNWVALSVGKTRISNFLLLIVALAPVSLAQYSISTIAGGGPNNLPQLMASIGATQSVVLDSAGNILSLIHISEPTRP